MRVYKCLFLLLWLGFMLLNQSSYAQKKLEVHWLSFSQLNDSLQVKPKKVFVNFYADWCTYCKEMEQSTFTNEQVIKDLNEKYYAVKMNIESRDTIIFGNQTFTNKRSNRINPIHEIALLMASRKDRVFSLPAFVLFDEKFIATSRYFQFLDAEALLKILDQQ